MLSDCIFSSNKRAKNWRDKEHEYKHKYNDDWYGMEESAREKKESYYLQKEILLNLVKPKCIHREEVEESYRIRYYDYEPEYSDFCEEFIYENSYYDRECNTEVYFGDVIRYERKYNYYLFYDLGFGHTFHRPLIFGSEDPDKKFNEYPELSIYSIDNLVTYGEDKENLLSNQFVKEVIKLIQSEKYRLIAK